MFIRAKHCDSWKDKPLPNHVSVSTEDSGSVNEENDAPNTTSPTLIDEEIHRLNLTAPMRIDTSEPEISDRPISPVISGSSRKRLYCPGSKNNQKPSKKNRSSCNSSTENDSPSGSVLQELSKKVHTFSFVFCASSSRISSSLFYKFFNVSVLLLFFSYTALY